MVFSFVWSQDASAKAKPHKKKPAVSQKKHAVKPKKTAKAKPAKALKPASYRSSYLRRKHTRSVASTPIKKAKKNSKSSSKAHSKKKKNRNY